MTIWTERFPADGVNEHATHEQTTVMSINTHCSSTVDYGIYRHSP